VSAPRPRSRPSVVLLVIVLVALVIGAAASLVAGAAAAPPFHSGPDTEFTVPVGVFEAVLLGILLVGAGLGIWVLLGTPTRALPGRFAAFGLAAILVGVVFVVLLQVLGSGAGGFYLLAPSNGTTPTGTPTNDSTNLSLNGPGGTFGPLVPSWALFVVVAVVACVVAAVALPSFWSHRRRIGREPPARRRSPPEVEAALATAAQRLAEGNDPRQVILALYGALLRRVDPMVGGVDPHTPEEIRRLHLVRLGIRPSAAETLTRIFEEARYSTHPIGPASAAEAREAIATARADLDRSVPLP